MTFDLSITLGNDAMQTGEDVSRALRVLASNLERYWGNDPLDLTTDSDACHILDANGNTVGTWTVKETT